MSILQSARVLVIDDSPEEAIPVIKALGIFGIGCVYVSGDKVEELKRIRPLKGIRLAFVDMRLGTYGTSKEAVAATVNVIKQVIDAHSSPILFVAWTQHPEDTGNFKKMLSTEMPSLQPVSVRVMRKPFSGDLISGTKTLTGVRKVLKDRWPLGVLWCWEQMSHDATTGTTQVLADVVSAQSQREGKAWSRSLAEVLKLLVITGAGQSQEAHAVSQGLLEVFNCLHLDGLNQCNPAPLSKEGQQLLKAATPKLSAAERAVLNSMLLLLPVATDDAVPRPGNLYVPRTRLGVLCPHQRCKPEIAALLRDCLSLNKDTEFRELSDKLASKKSLQSGSRKSLRKK